MMNVLSTNTPVVVNSGLFDDDHSILDEARIRRELMRGAIVDVDPLDEAIVDVDPMNEVIVQETPTGETIVYKDSVGETLDHGVSISTSVADAVPPDTDAGSLTALLDRKASEQLHTRWNAIQVGFVDEPRSAVQQADALVSEVIEKITQMFANEHDSLEDQWHQSSGVSTEDLRIALQHYRAFFDRLVMQIPA